MVGTTFRDLIQRDSCAAHDPEKDFDSQFFFVWVDMSVIMHEFLSDVLLSSRDCLRRNASRHVADTCMEEDAQCVQDELESGRNVLFGGSLVCEDLCQMTHRVEAQVESERLRVLCRAAPYDSHHGDPR